MRTIGTVGAVVAGLAVVVIGLAPTVVAADGSVSIAGFAFNPASIAVQVGDTVTWTNGDGINHTATADGGSFNTGVIAGGASASVTFPTAGSFPYHCAIHASMTGTVVVEAAATTPAPTAGRTPSPTPRGSAAATARPAPGATAVPAPATDTLSSAVGGLAGDPLALIVGAFGLSMLIGTLIANRRLTRRDD